VIRSMLSFRLGCILLLLVSTLGATGQKCPENGIAGTYMGLLAGDEPIWVQFGEGKRVGTTDTQQLSYTMILRDERRIGTATVHSRGDSCTIFIERGLTGVIKSDANGIHMRSDVIVKDGGGPTWRIERLGRPKQASSSCKGELCIVTVGRQAERELANLAMQSILRIRTKLDDYATGAEPHNPFAAMESRVDNVIVQARKSPSTPAVVARVDAAVVPLRADLESARTRITMLETQLAEANTKLEDAEARAEAATQKVAQLQAPPPHRYAVMPYDDLLYLKIVERHRSFFWTTYRLTALPDDFNELPATETELTIRHRVQLLTILTPHPRQSYDLVPISDGHAKLKIRDPEKFWTTPYLVIGVQ
jgi:hypothetical protein